MASVGGLSGYRIVAGQGVGPAAERRAPADASPRLPVALRAIEGGGPGGAFAAEPAIDAAELSASPLSASPTLEGTVWTRPRSGAPGSAFLAQLLAQHTMAAPTAGAMPAERRAALAAYQRAQATNGADRGDETAVAVMVGRRLSVTFEA